MISIYAEEINDVIIVHAKGMLTMEHLREAEEAWQEELQKRPRIMAFDFSGITEIDSISINHIFMLVKAAARLDVKLIVCNSNEMLDKIFDVVRLNKLITFMPNQKFNDEFIKKY
jgi:anti-anti-sigma factor